MQARQKKNPTGLSPMWFERAERIMKEIEHTDQVLEFFNFMAKTSQQYMVEYNRALRKEGSEKADKLREKLLKFIDDYSKYELNYDIFYYENDSELFME